MEEREFPNTIYIYTNLRAKEKVSFLIPSKRPTVPTAFISLSMADKTIGGCVRTRVRMSFAGAAESGISVEIVRPSIWQLRGSLGIRGLNRMACVTCVGSHPEVPRCSFCLKPPQGLLYLKYWTKESSQS